MRTTNDILPLIEIVLLRTGKARGTHMSHNLVNRTISIRPLYSTPTESFTGHCQIVCLEELFGRDQANKVFFNAVRVASS